MPWMAGTSFPALTGAFLDDLLRRAGGFHGPRETRAALVRALRQEHLPSPRVAALGDPRTVAVVTGQQPAVGGGPLYTLLKTAHAIALAEALRARGQPCEAVFWCASEDHDLGEAGHADVVTRSGEVARFAGDLGAGHASLRFRPAVSWYPGLLTHLQRQLGDGLGTAFLQVQAPVGQEGLGAWLNRLLRTLFGDALICVESFRLRGLWQEGARSALMQWPARELERLRQGLLDQGGHDAFGELAQAPFFADMPHARSKLTSEQALQLLQSDAGSLSPGAAVRPILQQLALPAVAYVGGDGELAYHAFLTPLYATLQAQAPLLVPRLHATLAPQWLRRACARWGVTEAELVTRTQPPSLDTGEDPLAGLVRELDALLARYQGAASERVHLRGRLHRLRRARAELAHGLQQEARRRLQLPAFGHLSGYVRPRNEPQERVMSLMQAVWEHGPGITQYLVREAAKNLGGGTTLVTLDSDPLS
jgi:hypothetical protein